MIKNFLNKKSGRNKKGSMLTLVLVILLMSLIFISSSIMVTNSTRSRYLDNVLSGQARISATSVAEAIWSAIEIQEITDQQLEDWCQNGVEASTQGMSIPGLGDAGDNYTSVVFSKGGDGDHLFIDVTTRLGAKGGTGDKIVENVCVVLKKKPPTAKANLFDNLIEVGDSCSFSELHVGAGAPAGVTNNSVLCHGSAKLTQNGTGSMASDLIFKDRVTLGNGTKATGSALFVGPNAGFKSGTGQVEFNDVYFISPSGAAQGKVFETDSTYVDSKAEVATFFNFKYNGRIGQNALSETKNYYNAGSSTINTGNSGYDASVNGNIATNAGNSDYSSKASQMLAKAVEVMKPENNFPTVAQASDKFLQNVPQEIVDATAKTLPSGGGELAPGKYNVSGTISGQYKLDASAGGYIINVVGDTNFSYNGGCFVVENGDPNDDSNWPRIIIQSGKTLSIGGADAGSNWCGIVSTEHTSYPGPAKQGTKPTCYVYGYENSHLAIEPGHVMFDAYGGVYGGSSSITINGLNYVYGRIASVNFSCDNVNGTSLPYCPGPQDDIFDDSMKVATTDYEVERFKYYY